MNDAKIKTIVARFDTYWKEFSRIEEMLDDRPVEKKLLFELCEEQMETLEDLLAVIEENHRVKDA